MGLDISAFSKLKFTGGDADDYDYPRQARLWVNRDFSEHCDGLDHGIYDVTGESHRFRAGSYSGYNHWREQPAGLLGTTPQAVWNGGECLAFAELIHNSDCEGFIGPKTSAKLAKDFADWEERAKAYAAKLGDSGEWFLTKYADWKLAFELAADDGAVVLH